VELYAAVRRAVYVEGISERAASKRFGIARKTVHKMPAYAAPPGYQRKQPVKRPKLEAFVGVIDQILEADRQQIRKQRHTSKRIFERLRQEHGYTGGYTVVKDYVREQRLGRKRCSFRCHTRPDMHRWISEKRTS
jgi:transposase